MSNIKITALTNIGSNISYTTLLPVVNMSGTPETQKANLQILGNHILNNAGGSYFASCAKAIVAETVANAAQPNITSVGTLTGLSVNGNIVAANITANTGVFTGNGSGLTNLAGGNVSGAVAFAAVANSVAAGNVSGLGNISIINLDGNVSNVLRGDGTFGSSGSNGSYGNSDVVSLLAAFGSNTITTTGLITGNGGGLSNIPYANITGTPVLGNIATINLDGNASNVLRGNGSFGPESNGVVGNKLTANLDANGFFISNAANITANYFVGTATNIEVEAVNNNFSYHVVLTTGAGDSTLHNDIDDSFQYNPQDGILTVSRVDTEFLSVTNSVISNLVPFDSLLLNLGSNTNRWNDIYLSNSTIYLGDATISANGNSIVVDSIIVGNNPPISNLGNISTINLNGNTNSILRGDGTWGVDANSSYGNSNVVTLLSSFGSNTIVTTGNISAGNIIGNGQALTGINGSNVTGEVSYAAVANAVAGANVTGEVSFAVIANSVAGSNVTGEVSFAAVANSVAIANITGIGNIANINLTGSNSNVLYGNGVFAPVTGGAGAVISNGNSYANVTASNGNVVIGVNNIMTWTFDTTGNLVLAGGNSVIFSTANSSLDPLNPNVSTMTLTPDSNYNSQVLVLDPTAPGHIHLRAHAFSNIDDPAANIFLGGEATSFEITQGANNDARIHSGSNTWYFENNGNLVTPGLTGTYIKSAPGGYMGLAAMNDGGDQPAQLVSINSNLGLGTTAISAYANEALIQTNIAGGNIQTWVFDNDGAITFPNSTLKVPNENEFNITTTYGNDSSYAEFNPAGPVSTIGAFKASENKNIFVETRWMPANTSYAAIGVAGKIWYFDEAGHLTLPGNTFSINYANGTQASAPLVDVLNTNGLSTVYYPTFVEDRTDGQIVRADVDLSYTTDTNTLTVGNVGVTGNISAKTLITTPILLANLTATPGARSFISDSNLVATGNWGAIVSGGGSNTVPVWSDGTNWYIG